MAISTNQKPRIYRNLYENTDPGEINCLFSLFEDIYIMVWFDFDTVDIADL